MAENDADTEMVCIVRGADGTYAVVPPHRVKIVDEVENQNSKVIPRGYLLDYGLSLQYHEGTFETIPNRLLENALVVFALYRDGTVSRIKDRNPGESLGKRSERQQREPQAPENAS